MQPLLDELGFEILLRRIRNVEPDFADAALSRADAPEPCPADAACAVTASARVAPATASEEAQAPLRDIEHDPRSAPDKRRLVAGGVRRLDVENVATRGQA